MYETFVKQFIDSMDEQAPVILVRNRIELPLGSVEADQSTIIHSRLDLLDDASPFAEIVLTPKGHGCHVDYAAHVPVNDKIKDQEFMDQVRQAGQVDSISVLQPIDGYREAKYVVTGHIEIDFANNDQNANSATHEISEKIAAIMKAGGFDPVFIFEKEDDDLVTWQTE
jgi:hypothetical protein